MKYPVPRFGITICDRESAEEVRACEEDEMKSDDCHMGRHEDCDGTNLDSVMGCTCDCHNGDD